MNRVLGILWCIVVASGAAAQTAEVRSGEHSEFTRLIIDLPERMDWRISQSENTVDLIFPNRQLTFETNSVFERIPRDRLTNINSSPKQGVLQLDLGCKCDVSAFWHGKSLLVLDIFDREGEAGDTLSTTEITANYTLPNTPPPMPPLRSWKNRASSLKATDFQRNRYLGKQLASKTIKNAPPHESSHEALLDEAQNQLVRQIGRAASQGLLAPRSNLPEAKENPRKDLDIAPDSKDAFSEPDLANQKNLSANINIEAQSSIDRDFMAILINKTDMRDVNGCIDFAQIDVNSWGDERPFAQQIGPLRTKLIGEFDKVDTIAAIELARKYIYFGFGAEAQQTLELVDEETVALESLRALSEIMESGHSSSKSVLSSQLSCDTPASLWSALSYRQLPSDSAIEINAILRAFSALPSHLRRHLGPILSRRFLEAGRQETANEILHILDRNDHTVTLNSKLVSAEMDIFEGDDGDATEKLEDVTQSGSELSAEALVKLISTKLKNAQAISFDEAQLAGAYSQQHRGEPIGRDLIHLYVIALASSHAFDQAYRELERLDIEIPESRVQEVKSDLLAQLTQYADEITFLRHTLAYHLGGNPGLDSQVANATAKRLIELGFIEQAEPFLTSKQRGEAGRVRQLMKARIALAKNRPLQAELELVDVTGVDAELLRAEARSAAGAHLEASKLFASIDQGERSISEAWFAEDWESIEQTSNQILANVARVINSAAHDEGASNPDSDNGLLAQNRTLIEHSAEVRSALGALLRSKPSPIVTFE